MNLPLPVAVGIWVVVGLLLLVVVLTGRRRLATRTSAVVPPPLAVPAAPGEVLAGPFDAVYVSSTLAGDWLARVGAHGLGDRSAAAVTVHEQGVVVARRGAPDLFVPAAAVTAAGTAPGMAGKYVGKDGLVVITWTAPASAVDAPVALDTGLRTLRAADRAPLLAAVRTLVAPAAPETSGPDPDPSGTPGTDPKEPL
ncbi:hypothetical protein [Oerskovia flava]|uniref:PH-like domain-containing protein n=1 Tax=Oerskovia flava TaxID=2986422 RepID=UPI0022407FE1|nr:hypothetical protein [Oerskovia sp. JB1-3-2]